MAGKKAEKKKGESKPNKDLINQVFGLRIVKEVDRVSNKVHLQVKSQSEGLPMSEAILLVEGWLEAEKKKMLAPVFQGRK